MPWVVFLFSIASAAVCEEVTLRAEIGAGGAEISGALTCTARQAGALALATYPAVLADERGLNDVNREWFYPEGFSPAGLRVWHRGTMMEADAAWLPLGEAAPGELVTVEFATRVPRRNGTFGRTADAVYLLGGWHPAFGDGERLTEVPIRFQITVPPGWLGTVAGKPVTRDGPRTVSGTIAGRFVPVLLARALLVEADAAGTVLMPVEDGASVRRLGVGRRAAAVAALRETLTAGAAFASRFGLERAVAPLVVLTPLRENLVEAFDGGLAVSDRAFRLLGFERFLKLHRASVWRHQLAWLALPACRARETTLPPELVADLVASALLDRQLLEVYGQREDAAAMLERVAVIPEIDALIFAPQVSFVTSYFNAIDETPSRRWRLDDFDHTSPRGKLLYEKLKDRLGEEATAALVTTYLSGAEPLLAVAERAAGEPLADWVDGWLRAYPRLNYALQARRDAAGLVAQVEAQGPEPGLVEPITVELVDRDGAAHRRTRLGPGELRFPVAQVDVLELDPDHRLVELWSPPGRGPRFDNRLPPSWRLLLTNIASVISASNGELELAANFSLRRLHDLRWRWDFLAAYSPTKVAAATTASWGFGPEVTPLVLANRVGLSLAYERLRREGPSILPGDQLSLLAYYRHDDRLTPYWSFEGDGLSAHAAWAVGRDTDGQWYQFGNLGAGVLGILPLAFGHALVGRLRGDLNLGDAPPQDRLSVGSLYRAGRGYLRDDGRGDRRAVATAEYRHLWSGDANTDLGGLVTWTRWEGALFADGIYLDVVEPAACDRSAFVDVGYGLRFIGDVFGVSPAALTVDLGVPLWRCVGERGPPVTVYVGFVQSLAAF